MLKPKSWILDKNLTIEQKQIIDAWTDWTVINETEKAYRFEASTDYGNVRVWCPKSQVEEVKEYWEEDEEEEEAYKAWCQKMDKGLEYNTLLKETLNANGVKVSMNRRFRTAYLIEKLNANGIAIPERA